LAGAMTAVQFIAALTIAIVFGGMLASLQALGEGVASVLEYQRDSILAGEYWRLLTGHFVHLGWSHMWLNAGSMMTLIVLFRQHLDARRLAVLIPPLGVAISAAFLLFDPEIQWYRGASGLVYALIAWSLLDALSRHPQRLVPGALLLVMLAKVGYDYTTRVAVVDVGAPVIVEAHVYGIAAAVVGYAGVTITRLRYAEHSIAQ
jgi:rhomboid family GlyGly-CTERM serine protease